jgi:hypothetical protein
MMTTQSMKRLPLAIPGLKLTASETKDGTQCVGKGTNLSRSAEFDVDHSAPTEVRRPLVVRTAFVTLLLITAAAMVVRIMPSL